MNDDSLTDCQVVKQVQQGHSDAFDILVRRYQARMRATVAHYIASQEDVFDIVQEAFLEAFRGISAFDAARQFAPWLHTICRRRMVDFLRRRKVRYQVIQVLIDQGAQQDTVIGSGQHDIRLERLQALKHCFGKLNRRGQDLIHLRYRANLAVKEIAHRFGRTETSISSRLYRIRETLARCVQSQLAQEIE